MKKAILASIILGLIATAPLTLSGRGNITIHSACVMGPQLMTFYFPPVVIPGPNGAYIIPGGHILSESGNIVATGFTGNIDMKTDTDKKPKATKAVKNRKDKK